ncbi:hypothetical protein V491_00579 [Pseudogymnoascus sp. VKM F-3775]|nr:hypothetical protein V491_00579 [Pseudogymnoascus sp. VKM F-3775]
MYAQDPPKLKVLLGNGYVDIEDAVERERDIVLETLISAFLLLPLSQNTLTRLQLGDCFRRSLQSSRQTTPYRLHTIVTECKAGSVDTSSLEAKFFEYGGVRTVTALAAAAADNKQIVSLLKGLSNAEFQAFLKSIDAIEPHRDLLYIIETLERKKPSRLSKRKHVPGPRPPRPRPRPRDHYSPIPGSPSTVKPQGGGTSITSDHGQTAENVLGRGLNTLVGAAFQQNDGAENHTFTQGKSRCLTGSWQCDDNYRIDLDNLQNTPSYGIDGENSNFEHYAIDLGSFNAL